MRFDLNTIPLNAIIEEAVLSLTEIPFAESAFWYRKEPVTDYQLDSKLKIFRVTHDWNESSISDFVEAYSTITFDSSSLIDSYQYSSGIGNVCFNVTNSINAMFSGDIENYGFVMMTDYRFTFAKSPGGSMTYWHSGQSEDIAKRPTLKIKYSLDGNTYAIALQQNEQLDIKCSYEKQGVLKLNLPNNGIYNVKMINLRGQELLNIKRHFNAGLSLLPIGKLKRGTVVIRIDNLNNNKTIHMSIP